MKPNIVLVEDNLELSENIVEMLQLMGHHVLGAFTQAADLMASKSLLQADIFLIDIQIEGDVDGIQLASIITSKHKKPVIMITAFSEPNYIRRASKLPYTSYLLKPFGLVRLQTEISLMLNRYAYLIGEEKSSVSSMVAVKEKGKTIPIPANSILYLEAQGLYTNIVTEEKKYIKRVILKDLENQLDDKVFLRVHKSFAVNLRAILSFNASHITLINEAQIPLRRGFTKKLKEILASYSE